MLPKLKCHQTEMSQKTEMSPKLKCHQNWNITKTEMLPKLKCHKIKNKCIKNWNLNLSKSQEIGTDHLGLVIVRTVLTVESGNFVVLFLYALYLLVFG